MKQKLLEEGAEAKIFLIKNRIIKERIQKKYRHKVIDEKIRKQRTKREGKLLFRSYKNKINVPKIYNINKKGEPHKKYTLEIEYINGEKLSDKLNSYNTKKQYEIMKKIAKEVAKLHEKDIIHGDLTTSNMILRNDNVFIIDFGLGYISRKIEDKAVDLHLIKQALVAKHFLNSDKLFRAFVKAYKFKESRNILSRLEIVEKRGRYKRST